MSNDLVLNLRIRTNADGSTQVINQTAEGINRISTASGKASDALRGMDSASGGMASSLSRANSAIKSASDLTNTYIDKLEKQVALHGKSATEILRYEASLLGTTKAQQAHIAGLLRTIDAQEKTAKSANALHMAIVAGGAAYAAYKAAEFAGDVFQVNKEFQSLRTSLSTTVGGLENAGVAFSFVQDFAAKTPYDVAQVTESFIRLGNLGLKPSEEALRSYGNTAAAQSKPIMQMIEAVADATTGEFERLKEFGIKASQEKDKVTFTFQGVSTTVKNSASEIERYLIDLGNNKFGDAMAGQAKIINGAVSNLDDTWDAFMDNLLDDTKENLIAKWIADAAAAIKWLDIGINGAVRSADKLAVIDQRIAANRASLAAHKSNGMVGSMIDDFAGYDVGLKQNQIDRDIKAREALTKEIEKQKTAQDELISSIGKSNTAKSSSADVDKKAASEAKKLVTAEENRRDSVQATIASLQFELEVNRLGDKEKALQIELHKNLAKAKGGEIDQITQYTQQIFAEANARKAQQQGLDAGASAMDAEIERYNKLTQSAREYQYSKLLLDGVSPGTAIEIVSQSKASDDIEQQRQAILDARSAFESYNNEISNAKDNMSDFGSVSSAVFDGALGGISAMTGAFSNMIDSIEKINVQLDEEIKKRTEIANAPVGSFADIQAQDKAIADSIKKEEQLRAKKDLSAIAGTRQVAGSIAKMFAENTKARQVFHNIEMTMAAIEMAMNVKKITTELWGMGEVMMTKLGMVGPSIAADTAMGQANAVAGVANQANGDPYSAFPRMAAMAAIMTALGFAVAGGLSGGSEQVVLPPENTTGTGTVLGDPEEISQSINNTYTLLQDIHAAEYAELRGINAGISALSVGIDNTVTKLFQSGGITAKLTKDLAAGSSSTAGVMSSIPLLGGLFGGGKTTETIGGGLALGAASIADILAGAIIDGVQYTTIKTVKKGGLFSKDKTTIADTFSPLDASVREGLSGVFRSAAETMLLLTDTFGDEFRGAVENYVIPPVRIELAGLSGQDAVAKVTGVVSSVLDDMASSVFGGILRQYQQLGEGMLETAIRIVSEVAVVQDALSKSGLSISGDAIAISDGLAQAAGGLIAFQDQFNNYYDRFYTDAEKHAGLQKNLAGQLGYLNVLLPDTRDGYRRVIEALDINNAADQERYSMLLKLSDAADSYYQTIESQAEDAQRIAQQRRALDIEYMTLSGRALGALIERRKDELAALDPSLRWRQQAVWAASEANKAIDDAMATLKKSVADQKALNASAHQAKIDALTIERQTALEGMTIQKQAATDLLNSLKTVAANIKTALGSTVIESQTYMRKRRADAQDVLSAALSAAQAGGSLANFKGLDQALVDIAKPSEQLHATFVDYAIDQARTGAVISSLGEHATAQISVAEQTLAAIEANTKQVSASIEASTKELKATLEADNAALDALITTAQAQIDAARGTTAEVMSVKDAVDNLARALEVRSQTLKAIEAASAATAFADAAKKIADDANSQAQSSADALAAQIALSEQATKAATDAQRDATAKATWQPAPNTWIAGQSGNPLWEKVLAAFNAEHTAKYGIAMNRPWSSDAPSQHQYRYLVGEYNSLASAAAAAAQASASALSATADAIKTAIPNYQAVADADAMAASTANADAAAKAAAAASAQSAAVEFEYTSPGGAAINKIADKFYNAFNGLTVSASNKKDNFEALRRESGFGAVYELATRQGLDSKGLDMLMDWAPGTSAQKAENWKLPAFDVGINNVPFDMAAIVHQGERIFPAADNRELMMRLSEPRQSGVQVDALVAEVQELRRVAAELQGALNKIEKNTGGTESSSKRMADQLRSMTPDGQSLRVTTA